MKALCPNCERATDQVFIEKDEEFDIRGQMIPVHVEYYHCNECCEDYEIPRLDYDPMDEAFREYRNRNGMVQPEEIKGFRKGLGLTQKELSDLLGIGIATLNRYENGALQTEAHDHILHLCMQPQNLLHIIEKKPSLLTDSTKEQVITHLAQQKHDCNNLVDDVLEKYGNYSPNKNSGFKKLDINKLFQSIRFFCFKDQVGKTKLMKLLFYADFKHYKEYGVSITGACYAHAPHGPILHNHLTWLSAITEWLQLIKIDEQLIGGYTGEVYSSDTPDFASFSTSELEVLAYVNNKFHTFTAAQIKDFSHHEDAYKSTKDGELISYMYAQSLQI